MLLVGKAPCCHPGWSPVRLCARRRPHRQLLLLLLLPLTPLLAPTSPVTVCCCALSATPWWAQPAPGFSTCANQPRYRSPRYMQRMHAHRLDPQPARALPQVYLMSDPPAGAVVLAVRRVAPQVHGDGHCAPAAAFRWREAWG